MTKRVRYEVLPTPKAERKAHPSLRRWSFTRDGERMGTRDTKPEAVEFAVVTARAALKQGQLSELIIKRRDGVIQDSRTYGADPEETKG